MNSLWRIFCLAAALCAAAGSAAVQQTPVSLAELQRIAAMPEVEQRRPAQQTVLHRWFFEQVAEYQNSVRETAIGRSSLVSPGVPRSDNRYRSAFSAPTGSGRFIILFLPAVTTATTDPEGWPDCIAFPAQKISLSGGNNSTCWHESLHAVLGDRRLTVNPLPYEDLLKDGDPNYDRENIHGNQEHVYINVLAENTFFWLWRLKGFEKEIGIAANHLEELKADNTVTNLNSYEVENAVWSKAYLAWQLAWKAAKKIAFVTQAQKDEFTRYTGVRVPYVEDVIAWYMAGNMTVPQGLAHAGTPARVPRWVMDADPLTAPALIDCQNQQAPKLNGDQYAGSLSFTIQERRAGRVPITHGKAQFWAQTGAKNVRFKVTLGGKPLALLPPQASQAWRVYQANLSDPKLKPLLLKREPFQVTVLVTGAHQRTPQSKDLVIPLHILYTDTTPAGTGKAPTSTAPLYTPAEAIYQVRISGGPGPLKTAAAAKKPKASASRPVAATPKVQPRWVLIRVDEKHETGRGGLLLSNVRFSQSALNVGGGHADGTFRLRNTETTPPSEWSLANHVTWSEPPSTIPSEAKLNFTYTAVSQVQGDPGAGAYPGMSCSAWYEIYKSDPPPIDLNQRPYSAGIMPPTGPKCDPEHKENSVRQVVTWRAPTVPRDKCYLVVNFNGGGTIGKWLVRYVYTSDPAAATPTALLTGKPQEASAKPTAESAVPPQRAATSIEAPTVPQISEDKRLSNEPPKPGEVVPPRKDTETPPPPATKIKERWYVHPERAYRFRLTSGWSVAACTRRTTADDGWDTLTHTQYPCSLLCGRGHGKGSGIGSQVDSLLGGLFGAKKVKPTVLTLGDTTATAIAKAGEDGVFWDITVRRDERSYSFQVYAPGQMDLKQLPQPVAALLETLRFE